MNYGDFFKIVLHQANAWANVLRFLNYLPDYTNPVDTNIKYYCGEWKAILLPSVSLIMAM